MTDLPPPFPPIGDIAQGWKQALDGWGQVLAPLTAQGIGQVDPKDRRFNAPEWDQPVFDLMRQAYSAMSERMMTAAQAVEGLDPQAKAKLLFATQMLVDAMSPANSPFTNPVALQKAVETNGASLMTGLSHMMADLARRQLTHTDPSAFKVGENIAATPGKVIYQTPLYQLIHYTPTTDEVLAVPLIIFPPWINRFYILDLTPEKSFIKWCVDQGLSVFVVSWKSADASMADVVWDDYIAAQIDAIEQVRSLLSVPAVHTIGYCVAGTTLAATLAVLAAKGAAETVASATFFTAQVDFSAAGDLLNFIDDAQLAMITSLETDGYLDGRYLALAFNMLRGRDLIWSNVVSNYLLGQAYPSFDLLHWNGDVTNLPAKWHRSYLCDLYRDNKLVQPGVLSALGVPIDLNRVRTPAYIQAGRDDHIAPVESVWKLTEHLKGQVRFVLAGSGHIAGVVNPPSAQKYQHWINEGAANTLADFIAGATEHKGSWWFDWLGWVRSHNQDTAPAQGARIPGGGRLSALEDAPGTYVKTR
jgi:polyhydroxyalkanoate synthase subunit PhaC